MLDKNKYIGKWWHRYYYTKRRGINKQAEKEKYFFIFDITHRDNYSEYDKEENPYLYGLLALEITMSNGQFRYSFSNPTTNYQKYFESFFVTLEHDEPFATKSFPFRKIIRDVFTLGPDRWKKRYTGYKNIGIKD